MTFPWRNWLLPFLLACSRHGPAPDQSEPAPPPPRVDWSPPDTMDKFFNVIGAGRLWVHIQYAGKVALNPMRAEQNGDGINLHFYTELGARLYRNPGTRPRRLTQRGQVATLHITKAQLRAGTILKVEARKRGAMTMALVIPGEPSEPISSNEVFFEQPGTWCGLRHSGGPCTGSCFAARACAVAGRMACSGTSTSGLRATWPARLEIKSLCAPKNCSLTGSSCQRFVDLADSATGVAFPMELASP